MVQLCTEMRPNFAKCKTCTKPTKHYAKGRDIPYKLTPGLYVLKINLHIEEDHTNKQIVVKTSKGARPRTCLHFASDDVIPGKQPKHETFCRSPQLEK